MSRKQFDRREILGRLQAIESGGTTKYERELLSERDRLREALEAIGARRCRVFTEPGEDCNTLKNKVPCEPCVARAALAGDKQT